jgi:phosphocarrier protein
MEKIEQEIEVRNPNGLHARPAALFIQIANKYDSSVKLEKDGEAIDGKSIIGILSLGINKGAKVKLIVEGTDARDAFAELQEFLQKNHE